MGKEKRQSPSTLLWFIRHKSYVPISEIRRRFAVDAEEGTFIDVDRARRVFVGLPLSTAQSIQKLWQQGKIGFEYSVEFDAQVLIGVYPMVPSKEALNGHSSSAHTHHHHPIAIAQLNGNEPSPEPEELAAEFGEGA